MCLALPGRIEEIRGDGEQRMARVSFSGVAREICLAYLPEAEPGDYVLVHVGFAISRIDEEAARETLELFAQLEEAAAADEDGSRAPR